MFGISDRFGNIEWKLTQLEERIDSLRRCFAETPSTKYVERLSDATDKDLRAEIALLAEALGYVREAGGPKYRKAK